MAGRERVSTLHPAQRAYADRHGLGDTAFLSDGAMSLIYDSAYRVEVRPHPDGRLVLLASLMDLAPIPASARDDMLVRLLRYAASPARDHASGLAIDAAAERLVLQQLVDGSVDVGRLEAELADFVNVVAFWSGICGTAAKEIHG